MKYLTRWQRPETTTLLSFGQLFGLRDELDRIFEGTLGELARGSQLLGTWNPAVDVFEDKDNVFVKAELPGMKKGEIHVTLHDGVLSISGKRKGEEKPGDAETCRVERFVGQFHRSIALPGEVQGDRVKAQYQDGILTITLPKAEAAKPKHIEVKVS